MVFQYDLFTTEYKLCSQYVAHNLVSITILQALRIQVIHRWLQNYHATSRFHIYISLLRGEVSVQKKKEQAVQTFLFIILTMKTVLFSI